MMRSAIAALLLLTVSWLIMAPVVAAGRSTCASCDGRSCCAPKPAGERCSLRRACCAGEAADPALPFLWKPAVMPVRATLDAALRGEALAFVRAPAPLQPAGAPLERPPRAAA